MFVPAVGREMYGIPARDTLAVRPPPRWPGEGRGVAIERVPTLDSEGKIKPAFWPDVVSDLTGTVASAVGTAVDALVPGLVDTAVADAVSEELGVKADAYPAQNHQTGTSYTFGLDDAKRLTLADNPAASTYTIPRQSSVAWLTDTVVEVVNVGAGLVTIAAGSGVTIENPTTVTLAIGESAVLIRRSADTWFASKGGGGLPKAVVSGGTESTLTNPDGDGKNYHLCGFTSNGTLTVSIGGWLRYTVVGSGACGYAGTRGDGGRVQKGWMYVAAGTYAVTVAAGATGGGNGKASAIGSLVIAGICPVGPADGTGAGATTAGASTGITDDITGTAVEYARATGTSTNPGDGGNPGGSNTVKGVVYVRAEA